ncbi:MAG: trypsin-like peptidase domain-containing protein, partial [Planctomycetia bacterium]
SLQSSIDNADNAEFQPVGYGSGVVVDAAGLVLTCYHVVRGAIEEGQRLQVRAFDGERYDATIHAADPRSDLAVLKLTPTATSGVVAVSLKPIVVAEGEKLAPGDFVFAIGNPFNSAARDGATSASCGIISNIRRRPAPVNTAFGGVDTHIYIQGTLLQSDARLNLGISGGALVDLEGRLVGVTMALAATVGGEAPGGYACPTDALTRRIIATLKDGREVEYGFMGIQPTSFETPPGASVDNIILPDVERAGLRIGDVITAIDGKPIRGPADLVLAVGSLAVGSKLKVKVFRGGETVDLTIPLAKFPVNEASLGKIVATKKRPVWNGLRVDHLSVLAGRVTFGANPVRAYSNGVVVREVEPGSLAEKERLQPGTVVTKFNGRSIFSPDEFDATAAAARGSVTLTVEGDREVVFPAAPDK